MVARGDRPLLLRYPSRSVPIMRVCHVSLTLATGGMERLLVDFARFHDRALVEPHFVVLGETGEPAREIRERGFAVHELRSVSDSAVTRVGKLRRLFLELRPHVVHTHNPAPQVWGTVAARLARVPCVVHTRHGHALGNLSTPVVAGLSWMADAVACVSEELLRDQQRRCRIPGTRILRIWNGIDTERFAWAGPRIEPVALAVCRLSPVKDIATLLRAMALVRQEVPEFRSRIAGDGPSRSALEDLAAQLGIRESVEFIGERSDVPSLLREAGLFVSSSLSEGLSLTLLEAMAVGIPVVATAVGGNPEVVDEGVTGWLVPPSEPALLARAVVRAWSNRGSWPEMGRSARLRVCSDFDVRRMVHDYEALYQRHGLERPLQRPDSR